MPDSRAAAAAIETNAADIDASLGTRQRGNAHAPKPYQDGERRARRIAAIIVRVTEKDRERKKLQ